MNNLLLIYKNFKLINNQSIMNRYKNFLDKVINNNMIYFMIIKIIKLKLKSIIWQNKGRISYRNFHIHKRVVPIK